MGGDAGAAAAGRLPASMRAVSIAQPGGPEVLAPVERPVPHPGPGEILIKVAAAGVNRADILQRQGKYRLPPGLPERLADLPGLEAAGTVAAVGDGVERWRTGDEVAALLIGGGYAEYAVAQAAQALPVPPGLSLVEAASLPEATFTVWSNVFVRGRLQAGETLLVHGGTSGIGSMAIQLGAALGARVIATAGSAAKCAACRGLGAHRAINYREEDFVEAVEAETGGHGADVILDMVGGDYVGRNIQAAAEDGRIVHVSLMTGAKVQVDMGLVMSKRLKLTGSTLRNRPPAFKAQLAAEVEARVWPLVADGRVKPIIDSSFPLAEAAAAQARMESSEHIGKITLTV